MRNNNCAYGIHASKEDSRSDAAHATAGAVERFSLVADASIVTAV